MSSLIKQAKINVIWEGDQYINHSFALINREICLRIGEEINLTIIPGKIDIIRNLKCERLKQYDIRYKDDLLNSNEIIWITHQWPPRKERPECEKWIIMQPWEYSLIPIAFVTIFNKADEIWVPSTFCQRAFENSGVKTPIHVIPNGVDIEIFKPNTEFPYKHKLKTKKNLRLLYVGGTIYRKGIDILLKVYTDLFTSQDDVCLIVKDIGKDTFYRNQNYSEQIKEIIGNEKMPEIEYLDFELSEYEMAELYKSCHLFISPYRGEGFSIPTLEAMACNLPVVVTKGGATDEFVNDDIGYFLKAEQVEIKPKGYEFSDKVYILEPDIEMLKKILRLAITNPFMYIKKVTGYQYARKYTWDIMADRILGRINEN